MLSLQTSLKRNVEFLFAQLNPESSPVDGFHFKFVRCYFSCGKLFLRGNYSNVLKQKCSIDVMKYVLHNGSFEYGQNDFVERCASTIFACIEKYRSRGYDIKVKPFYSWKVFINMSPPPMNRQLIYDRCIQFHDTWVRCMTRQPKANNKN